MLSNFITHQHKEIRYASFPDSVYSSDEMDEDDLLGSAEEDEEVADEYEDYDFSADEEDGEEEEDLEPLEYEVEPGVPDQHPISDGSGLAISIESSVIKELEKDLGKGKEIGAGWSMSAEIAKLEQDVQGKNQPAVVTATSFQDSFSTFAKRAASGATEAAQADFTEQSSGGEELETDDEVSFLGAKHVPKPELDQYGKVKCSQCSRRYAKAQSLRVHLATLHYGERLADLHSDLVEEGIDPTQGNTWECSLCHVTAVGKSAEMAALAHLAENHFDLVQPVLSKEEADLVECLEEAKACQGAKAGQGAKIRKSGSAMAVEEVLNEATKRKATGKEATKSGTGDGKIDAKKGPKKHSPKRKNVERAKESAKDVQAIVDVDEIIEEIPAAKATKRLRSKSPSTKAATDIQTRPRSARRPKPPVRITEDPEANGQESKRMRRQATKSTGRNCVMCPETIDEGMEYVQHCLQHFRDELLAGFEGTKCKICGEAFMGKDQFEMLVHAGFQHEVILDRLGEEVFDDLGNMLELFWD